MDIEEVLWLDVIEDKIIRKHHVDPTEVEEVFKDKPRYFFVEKGHVENEDLYSAIGITDNGRWLIVYFILKTDRQALVISARNAGTKEKNRYEKK